MMKHTIRHPVGQQERARPCIGSRHPWYALLPQQSVVPRVIDQMDETSYPSIIQLVNAIRLRRSLRARASRPPEPPWRPMNARHLLALTSLFAAAACNPFHRDPVTEVRSDANLNSRW